MTDEKLEFIFNEHTLKVTIRGDIDHHSAKGVREKIDEVMFKKQPALVTLDLGEVDFMDSSGLGLILGRYTNATEMGAEFVICNPTKRVKKILELAGIERIIEIKGENKNEAC